MTDTLFTDDGVATATLERPDAETVRFLEGFGHKADVVRKWTPERANTILANHRRDEAIALRRADDVARTQDEVVPRGQPTWPERMAAAAFIEQTLGHGIDELHNAVMYSVYALRDDELKRLAGFLIRLMRGQG